LGLSKNSDSGLLIEARQNYFHVFFLPCFDLGITWHLRKGPTLYALSDSYRQQIDATKVRVNTPWRTFTLPIFFMLSLVAYNANMTWERHQSDLKIEEDDLKNMEMLLEKKPYISENAAYEIPAETTDSLGKKVL
jgi:Golgi nucleoside diphosphatase